MTTQKLSAGIIAPSPEIHTSLARLVDETQLASVSVAVKDYCATEDDQPTRRFIEMRPDIVLVDMQNHRAGLRALCTIRSVLPETWLCAIAETGDPRLIIETMQAGARDFLPKPVSPERLRQVFSRYLDEKLRGRIDNRPRGKVYSVTSAKGGTGATFVTVNFALTLAEVPQRSVAVLDLNDPAGDAASYLNVKPRFLISDAIAAGSRLDSETLRGLMTTEGNVSLLSGPEEFRNVSTAQRGSLAGLLRVASDTYSDTIIDLPSDMEPGHLQLVTNASTLVLVVLTPEFSSIGRTHRFVNFLESIGCNEKVRLILNRHDSRDYISEREITRILNRTICGRLPNDYGAAYKAITRGRTLVQSKRSGLAAAYRKLTQELTGVVVKEQGRSVLRIALGRRHIRTPRILPL